MTVKKLLKKIMLLFFCVLISFVLLISLAGYFNAVSRINNEIESANVKMLRYINRSVADMISATDRNSLSFIDGITMEERVKLFENQFESDAEKSIFYDRFQRRMAEFIRHNVGVSSMTLYSSDIGVAVSSNRIWTVNSPEEKARFDAWIKMDDFYLIDGEYLVRPFDDAKRHRRGLVVLNLDMNSFSELFSSYTPLEQFFIFNRHGETVFGESGFNIETSFFSGESGYFKIKYKGAPGIAFYAKSDVNGWIYVNVAKNVHIYAEANAYLVSMSLLTLLALALAGVVVVIIHRLGRRPVNILEEEIRENFNIVKRKKVDALLNGEAADFTGGAFFSPSLSLYGENFIVLQIQAKAFSPETLSHVDAIVAEHTYGISALTSPGLLVCVLSFSADDMAAAYELARIVADYIRTILVYEYELDVAVGVGGYVKARADIPKSYNQAGNALKYSESAEKNPITAFEDIKNQINETPEIAAKPKPEPEIMKTIKKYVTRCFSDPTVTLGFVAENFNISVSYLSRLFKAHTDKTFLEYIIALRMEKAKQLLWETDMPVEEIVGEVGYRNYASFAKTFKKYAGISANEYRKERV